MANEKIVNRENLKAFREKYDERLETGQIVPSKSLVAKELETISPESGDIQETPFALQGTGTANGTSSVDTGTVGKHIQKQGSVYCVNQLVENGDFSNGTNGYTFSSKVSSSVVGGKLQLTITDNSTPNRISNFIYRLLSLPASAKAFFKIKIKSPRVVNINCEQIGATTQNSIANQWNTLYCIGTKSASNFYLILNAPNNDLQVNDVIEIEFIEYYNLTQWFNGNIPQDLLDNPSHWSWYQTYGDYIPYNPGELVASSGKYLVCGGRNVWDEEWELGRYDVNGAEYETNDYIRTKNPIRVIPGATYYIYVGSNVGVNLRFYDINGNSLGSSYNQQKFNTTFVVPASAYYVKFYPLYDYGTTYKHDITISIYYAGENYSQYYPYEQPKVYDTGNEELLSTGVKLSVSGEREDIYDYKEPSGLITRRVGSYTFTGNETWNAGAGGYGWALYNFVSNNSAKPNSSNDLIPNITFQVYQAVKPNQIINQEIDKSISYNTSGSLLVRDTSITTASGMASAMAGKTIYFELATPTTEQGTPFSENIEIDDFGTMGWYATYTDSNTNSLVSVPQGCKIFYPAWYVGFVDTLGQRADIDWNANNIVSQTDLIGYVKQVDLSSGITDVAGLTYQFKKLYKIGNVLTLTIRARNETGSQIASGSTLFRLPNGAYQTITVFHFTGGLGSAIGMYNIGNNAVDVVSTNQAIPNSTTVSIMISYAVA